MRKRVPSAFAISVLVSCLCSNLGGLRADPTGENIDLARARHAIEEVRFDEAYHALDTALKRGNNTPKTVGQIHGLLGEVAVALGKQSEAERQFALAFIVDPEFFLADGTSPKIVDTADAGRAMAHALGTLEIETDSLLPGQAILLIHRNPLGVVMGGRLTFKSSTGQTRRIEGRGTERVELSIPDDARGPFVLAAIDAFGNALREQEVDIRRTVPPQSPPLWRKAWIWGAGAAMVGAVGAGFGLAAQSSQSELNTLAKNSSQYQFSEAESVERRGSRFALGANLSFALAGALAVTGIVMYFVPWQAEHSGVTAALSGDSAELGIWIGF